MIKIDGVAKRNLQEQVGYNSEQIEKIFSLLDGLNVQDNLVKVASSSGIFTAEEMEIVSRDVAFISYNNKLFVKSETSGSEYIFKQVALAVTDQGAYHTLESFKIIVTIASGAYAYSSSTLLSTYDKSELDSLLSAKANLAGADFTGAVTAPTLEQTTPNVEVSFNFSGGGADIQLTNAYNRLIVVNGILYAIANIKMKNISGASKNIGGAWGGTPYVAVNLPASVASKIYDIDGVPASQVGTARKLITSVHASCISGTTGDAGATTYNDFRFDLTNTPATNQVACYFNSNQYITLAIDEEICLMARVALTLF